MGSDRRPEAGRITRRQFLTGAGVLVACGVGAAAGLTRRRWWERMPAGPQEAAPIQPPTPWSTEGLYYASFASEGSSDCSTCHSTVQEDLPVSYCHLPHTGRYVRCNLCPHFCIIADGERGHCRVRENRGGRLYSVVFGNPCTVHIDPIEKKPFFNYLPAAQAFSLATAGCNLRCLYCQNWSISQVPPEETQNLDLSPEDIVRFAREYNAPVIAYTYSEPTAFYEYMLATAKLARTAGLNNAVVSAGYINPEPLRELCQWVDAIKIDLKAYDEGFYEEVCGAELQPVLQAIETIFRSGTHLEIVNLVVPTLNDELDQLRALAQWIARELSPDVALHFTRFFPQYKLMNLPATPIETLERARETALDEGLRYVYVGNVPGHPGNNTYCPACGRAVILREGFAVTAYHLEAGTCQFCDEPIAGVWWPSTPADSPVRVPQAPAEH